MAELNIDGMAIAPGVIETIVSLAAQSVEGVACVGDPTTSGLLSFLGSSKPSTQGIEIDNDDDGALHISLRLYVKSGHVLPDIAQKVRKAIADAVNVQVGATVGSVDLYVDGIQFDD